MLVIGEWSPFWLEGKNIRNNELLGNIEDLFTFSESSNLLKRNKIAMKLKLYMFTHQNQPTIREHDTFCEDVEGMKW